MGGDLLVTNVGYHYTRTNALVGVKCGVVPIGAVGYF